MERREMLAVLGAASAAQMIGGVTPMMAASTRQATAGRLKQSVCRWCYSSIPLDVLCRDVAAMGLKSVELLSENEWATPKQFGLTCAVSNGPSTIPVGFNRLDQHDRLVAESERLLPLIAAAGIPQMIVFSGNRAGMSDAVRARELCRRVEAHHADRRTTRCDGDHGTAQLQGGSQGLHV